MAVQRVSVTIGGSILAAEALDLIHEVLLLRVETPRPIARGEHIPAAVRMPGSSEVSGSIVGIDGSLVRFETSPNHAITPAARLTPRTVASASETIVTAVTPGGSPRNASAVIRQVPQPPPPTPRPAAAPAPPIGTGFGAGTAFGQRSAARGVIAAPSAPAAQPRAASGVQPLPAALRNAIAAAPPTPVASTGSLSAPPRPASPPVASRSGITADVMKIATGRNEVPVRVAVIDISTEGAVLGGFDISPGRKVSVTLWLPNGDTITTLGVAEQATPSGVSVRFEFENQATMLKLAAAVAARSLPTAI